MEQPVEQQVTNLLSTLTLIRDELYTHFPDIANDYPIVELDTSKIQHFLGWTDFKKKSVVVEEPPNSQDHQDDRDECDGNGNGDGDGDEVDDDGSAVAAPPRRVVVHGRSRWVVQKRYCYRIIIKLRTSQTDSSVLPVIRLLPTFIHELAHAYREHTRNSSNDDDTDLAGAVRGRGGPRHVQKDKSKQNRAVKGIHSAHDGGFYRCYRELLVKSEELGIYSLPLKANKFGIAQLLQFDKVDMEQCPLSCCGTSPRFHNHHLSSISSTSLASPTSAMLSTSSTSLSIPKPTSITLVVVDASGGKQKMVALSSDKLTLDELLRVAAIKLNCRSKPRRAMTLQGVVVDDDYLKGVKEQTVIKICK